MGDTISHSHIKKQLPLLCVLSFISSRPAGLSHSISRLRQNAAANNVKLVSERHTTEVVLWCQEKSCLRHKQLTVTSLSSSVDPNCSSHWGSTHPQTHTPYNTHTAQQLELNHYDRQIKQGAVVKMQRVGISFVCSPAGLPNWLIKLE